MRHGVNDHSGRFRLATLYTREPFAAPRVSARCLHTAPSERGARIEIESDGAFGEEEKVGQYLNRLKRTLRG